MPQYIALIRKDPESDYGVDFPDFPGCVTAGSTMEEARKMAEEALKFHADGLAEDGEKLPAPRTLDAVMADPANADAAAFLVDVPRPRPKKVRINITISEETLRSIDEHARTRGISRSAFLMQAALRAVSQPG